MFLKTGLKFTLLTLLRLRCFPVKFAKYLKVGIHLYNSACNSICRNIFVLQTLIVELQYNDIRISNEINLPKMSVIVPYNLQKQPTEVFYKKRRSQKFRKIHRKTLVLESLFCFLIKLYLLNVIKRESLAQVFSCEFCKVSKFTFFYRTALVAASVFSL